MSVTGRPSSDPAAPSSLPIGSAADAGQNSTSFPPVKPRQSLFRRVVDALVAVGPFAAVLTAYGLIFDNLPDRWFTYLAIKYIFSGVAALAIGLALRLAAQYLSPRHIPEAPVPVQSELSPPGRRKIDNSDTPSPSPYTILAETAAALEADFREGQHNGATIYGWSQYIEDTVPPSAIGTSYGLRLALALDLRNHKIGYSRIVASLLTLQRPGGGWAASTQRDVARPEITALVLPAALRAGLDRDVAAELIRMLERMTTAPDAVAFNRTSVIATLVATLADIAPQSEELPRLARLLGAAAHAEGDRGNVYWGERLNDHANGTVPHTARAVVALKKAARVMVGAADLNATANAGINWLGRSEIEFTNTDEQLRRPVSGGVVDALFIGHFSAAWTARALMAADHLDINTLALRRSMTAVLESQDHGVWHWHDGSRPIWMTYQGASVLRDYLLRGMTWPP
jgi:hypothetical protein